MEKLFINFTPHNITLCLPNNKVKVIPPSGYSIRLVPVNEEEPEWVVAYSPISTIPICKPMSDEKKLSGDIDKFMEAKFPIASTMVADFCQKSGMKKQVFAPSTYQDHVLRDQGRIIGIKALMMYE